MTIHTRPLHEPSPADVQDAFRILADDWNREWEAKREDRSARYIPMIQDWLDHYEGSIRRAMAYRNEGDADEAERQLDNARFALRQAEILRKQI
jgi:hypothetical protein